MKPAKIVLLGSVEVRHLGRLAPQESATVLLTADRDPPHDLVDHVLVHLARRQVVEEEERAGSLHEDVVDAVVHETLPDRVVVPGGEGDLELGADSVRARHRTWSATVSGTL